MDQILDALTPNVGLMKAWQNWLLVALVFFLTGTIVHIGATAAGLSNGINTPNQGNS